MPSGITHMLLMKTFNEESKHGNDNLEALLDEKLKVLQVGALGPDLAYSQQTPDRDLFSNDDDFADLFHYTNTSGIPLEAFRRIKKMPTCAEKDTCFTFFLGFTAHIVADGIIHPFVRDKVGNYEDASGPHRALEMRLDAIFLDHLATKAGTSIDINFGELHDQIKDVTKEELKIISPLFSSLIQEVYGKNLASEKIEDWVDDLHGIFEMAANEGNCYYARFPGMKSYLYNDTKVVLANKENDLWLRNNNVVGRRQSFLGRDIHFLNDCVPQFYKVFSKIALLAYAHVYENGAEVDSNLITAINLDTGRMLADTGGKNLDQPAVYWGIA